MIIRLTKLTSDLEHKSGELDRLRHELHGAQKLLARAKLPAYMADTMYLTYSTVYLPCISLRSRYGADTEPDTEPGIHAGYPMLSQVNRRILLLVS